MKLLVLTFIALHPSIGLCSPLMAPNYEVRSATGDTPTYGAVFVPVETPSMSRDLGVAMRSEHPEDKTLESRSVPWSLLNFSNDCVSQEVDPVNTMRANHSI